MSQNQGPDLLPEDPMETLAVILLATLFGPALLLAFWDAGTAWLLEHHVLVPAQQAMVTIPTTGAGLDSRRLILLASVAALAVVLGRGLTGAAASSRQKS